MKEFMIIMSIIMYVGTLNPMMELNLNSTETFENKTVQNVMPFETTSELDLDKFNIQWSLYSLIDRIDDVGYSHIAKVSSVEELQDYYYTKDSNYLHSGTFFEDNFLLILSFAQGTTSMSCEIKSVNVQDDLIDIVIKWHEPEFGIGTAAMAYYTVSFEMNKDLLDKEVSVRFM